MDLAGNLLLPIIENMDRTLKSAVNDTFDNKDIMGEELEQDKDLEPICNIDLSKYEVLDSDPLKFDEEEGSVNSESFEEQREFKTNEGIKLYITKLGKYEVLDYDMPKVKKEASEISVKSETEDEKSDFEMDDFKPDYKIGFGKYQMLDIDMPNVENEVTSVKSDMDDDVILVSDDEHGNYEMLDCEQPNVDGVTISDTSASSDSNTVFCVLCQEKCDAQASWVCISCQTKCDEQDRLENTPQCLDEAVNSDLDGVNIEKEPLSGVGENEDSLFLTTIINDQKTYCCEICLQKTTNSLNMVRHIDTHVRFKRLECTQCSFCCSCKEDLLKHTYAHIVNSKIWQSADGVTEREKAQLQATVIDGRNVYFCQKCPYKALNASSLRNHLSSHKVKAYKCTECFHCYSKIADLKKHMTISHPLNNKVEREDLLFLVMKINGSSTHCCQICPYKTTGSKEIKNHIINIHIGLNREEDKHFLTTVIAGRNTFCCKICPYKNIFKYQMRKHVRIHMRKLQHQATATRNYKIYNCQYCSYETVFSGWFTKHIKSHSGNGGEGM